MARQLKLLATGQIIPTALHTEMQRSYLEYAMSVIVGRALPDVRDGLKPVHRRILYAMHELGLTPDRPFRKSARVVGDVLGKYHPHGDQSVYDALVRMVQDFSSRYPLLGGHGNFGSIDNDPPAAMRYTETRLSPIGDQGMLSDISEAIVDFTNNFDNSQQEPVVLPAQLPFLLLNGCTGIAVGMATNIPPHNLGEVVDGLIALIDDPQLSDQKLWRLIPGPDFPTGGQILETEGIQETYRHGKGLIPVRGVSRIETLDVGVHRRKERTAIIVTELPYQVNKSAWIEKIADLVNQGRLEGIADLRDESDRTGMRVVIELKRDAKVNTVLKSLYKQTALQSNFGAIMLALVDNQPRQLSLRQLLEEFLSFREQTLTRQYSHELQECQGRLHLLEGLLIALNNLDAVIDILRHAADGTTAKVRLEADLKISDSQANAILAMPMRRLTGLERQKLEADYEALQTRIQELQNLLNNRQELLNTLKKELRSLKRKFGDKRRTRIITATTPKQTAKKSESSEVSSKKTEVSEASSKKSIASEVSSKNPEVSEVKAEPTQTQNLKLFTPQTPPDDAILEITHEGNAAWCSPNSDPNPEITICRQAIAKQEHFITITDSAKAYPISVSEIPPRETQSISLLSLLSKAAQRDANNIVAHFFPFPDTSTQDLLLLTQQGRIKRLAVSQLKDLTNRGFVLIKLKEGDNLNYVCPTQEGQEAFIATSGGRILRFGVTDESIPIMGRNAQGNQGVKLRYGESLVGCLTINNSQNLLLVSQLGYGKQLPLSTLRLTKLGDVGTQTMQFTSKTDSLVGMVTVEKGGEILLLTNQNRQLKIPIDSVKLWGKDGIGDKLVKLKNEEIITKIFS